jgi:hypothetical protein
VCLSRAGVGANGRSSQLSDQLACKMTESVRALAPSLCTLQLACNLMPCSLASLLSATSDALHSLLLEDVELLAPSWDALRSNWNASV